VTPRSDSCAVCLRDVVVTEQQLRAQRPAVPNREPTSQPILRQVSLRVPIGDVLAVLGESGGGKSTLLRLVNRMLTPNSGEVSVLDRNVEQWDVRALRRTALYVPQRAHLFGGSVRDELSLPLQWNDLAVEDRDLEQMLAGLGLDGLELSRPAAELSEGQRTRLCLARALLLRPEILLLDEPTGALDVRTAREVLSRLVDWARGQRATLVVVTHRPEDLATLKGRAALLLGNTITGLYSSEQLLAGDVSDEVAQFLGSMAATEGKPT
jgi:putative ABC transport system ATP-binding protein